MQVILLVLINNIEIFTFLDASSLDSSSSSSSPPSTSSSSKFKPNAFVSPRISLVYLRLVKLDLIPSYFAII